MRRYLEHIRSREPHERRRHALGLASVITGVFFVAWVATLGVRLNTGGEPVPQDPLTAAAVQAQTDNAPHLEVSTSSVYSLPAGQASY